MDKDEALEALILKTGMNPVMQGSCYVMHPEALQAVIDEAVKQALAAPVSMTSESAQGVEQDERVFARIAAMKKPPAPKKDQP
jgi:hypothetical protein